MEKNKCCACTTIRQVLDLNISHLVRGRFSKKLFLGQPLRFRRTGVTSAASDCDQAVQVGCGNAGGKKRKAVDRITEGSHDGGE